MSRAKITKNAIRCKVCGMEIESKHRHDFVWCACRDENDEPNGCYVDGGHDYLRRGGDPNTWDELSESTPIPDVKTSSDILGLDEPLEPPRKVDEEKLSPLERILKRQGETIALLRDSLNEYERQGELIPKYRDAIKAASKLLKKNVLIFPGDKLVRKTGAGTEFAGYWIAFPKEEYEELKWFLENTGSEETDDD
jgi:hypothetical protein